MKSNKISLIISIVALIGVLVLLIAQFTGKETPQVANVEAKDSKIVYIDMDSLSAGYDLYNALSLQLTQKQNDLQQELQSKMMSLQNRANQLQNQYAQHLITSQKYQEMGEKLTNEQMQIQQWQDQKSLELNEDQLSMSDRINDSIKSAIDYINADKKYDLILSKSAFTGVVLYANPEWNITDQVVKILNERAKGVFAADSVSAN